MKKSLPVPLIIGLVVVALVVAGGFLVAPMMSTPGPDASQVHVSAEEVARQRANPPKDERPLPQFNGPGGGGRPSADSGHRPE